MAHVLWTNLSSMMKPVSKLFFFACLLAFGAFPKAGKAQLTAQFLGRYSTGYYDKAASEIAAYDPASKRMFVINGPDTSLRIVDISNPANPVQTAFISIKPYGIDLTSVACKNGLVATAVIDSNGKTNPSSIVFFDVNGNFINKVKAGPNADMLTFTPDGKKVLVANEGEPNVGYTIDPEGSVSIIDISNGVSSLTQAQVSHATFTGFNNAVLDKSIRIFGRIQSGGNFLRYSTVAEDLEPEYITISPDNKTAWATCQENNCIAEISIDSAVVRRLIPLGFKNHNLPGNGLDASDNGSTINIANYPLFGIYNPDAIAYSNGFLFTANEGDARADWGAANVEEIRFGNSAYVLDTAKFGGAAAVAALKANSALGRLTVSNRFGDFDNDGKMDSAFCFGGRSFSVWNATTGALVWDSKDQFEQYFAQKYPNNFNASHTNNTLKSRSDDKGPEPEGLTLGKIGDSTYCFIVLERIGGVMMYNITNPLNPYFVEHINTRNLSVSPSQANLNAVGDLGPESVTFIPASQSPNGKNLLLVSNEISGTVSIIQLNTRSDFQLQVLHSSDMESSLEAVTDIPNYAAVLDKLEDEHVNTLKLSSGDNYLPGPFMSAGEDASLQAPLRATASSYFGGTQALRAAIGRPDIAVMNILGFHASAMGNHEFDLGTSEMNSIIGVDIRNNGNDKRWIGAQFPFLSANLNFSNDANLSYLFTNQRLQVDSFKTKPTIATNTQKKGIAPSAIVTLNGQKIGLVGATTQILAKISSPGATTVTGPNQDDMPALAAILQPVIDSMRIGEGINKIILLSHLQQLSLEEALAPLLKGVDIIIAGGSHTLLADSNDRLRPGHSAVKSYPVLTQNADNEPVAILNTASEWKYIGRFVVDFDSTGKLIPSLLNSQINGAYATDSLMVSSLYGNYNAAFTPGTKASLVKQLTNAIQNVIIAKDGNKFGKADVFLEGRRNAARTEETNLGNVSADANLWMARRVDPTVTISIKNGGGIRSAIGEVFAVGNTVSLLPTAPNAQANKSRGDISQLDIENSLRFNNKLSIVSVNAAGLKRLLEHGVSATRPQQTPGQFPQVGGLQFSYDTTKASGSKIWSMVVLDSNNVRRDTIVRNGQLYGDTSRTFKVVTLDFLAGGGDNYPFPANGFNRINLDTALKDAMQASFAANGSEQDAFAEYMLAKHTSNAYSIRDTSLLGDTRIQLLNARKDGIFPETNPAISIAEARATAAPTLVRVRGIVNRAYGRFIYIQDQNAGIGVRQSTGALVDAIASGALAEGDSVEVIGPRNEFNNYAQIQLNSGAYTSTNTVIKLASGKTINPIQLTVKQLLANPEMYESRLVKITGLRSVQQGNFAASANYTVFDGTTVGDTVVLRVIAAADTELDDAPALAIPKQTFTFEGILAQFCSSPASGCTTGYQLYAIRKKDITADVFPLGAFSLVTPANNSRLVAEASNQSTVQINWTKSQHAIAYKWMIDAASGNFNPALLSLPSTNNGTDTSLTLPVSGIDAFLASTGLKPGDSILTKWTVRAYGASNDSLNATQSFNLTLVRKPVLGSFSLIAPSDNNRLTVEEGSGTPVQISWNKSSLALAYKWMAKTSAGNFEQALLSIPSDKSGSDTLLSLTSGIVDAVLASKGIAKGDSLDLIWTVFAYLNPMDSLKASQDFRVRIVRANPLTAFNLISPANNLRLVTKSGDNTPVEITWSASTSNADYTWLLSANQTMTPVLSSLPSNNAGKATSLTLTLGAIDDLLASNGLAEGDSINLFWTVRAGRGAESRNAEQTFGIRLVRDKATGIVKTILMDIYSIYPNPAKDQLHIESSSSEAYSVEVYNLNGQQVAKWEMASGNRSLPVHQLEKGIYLIRLKTDFSEINKRLVID